MASDSGRAVEHEMEEESKLKGIAPQAIVEGGGEAGVREGGMQPVTVVWKREYEVNVPLDKVRAWWQRCVTCRDMHALSTFPIVHLDCTAC
jgi:hypothetical protein